MKLATVQIQNFRSVEDSTQFSVAPVTCLVGKNESGKTAILQALYKLKPILPEDAKFDAIEEYPRQRKVDHDERLATGEQSAPDNVLTTTWELEDVDHAALAEVLGPEASDIQEVTIKRGYENVTYWAIPVRPASVVSHLLANADLYDEELKDLQGSPTIADLGRRLDAIEDPSPRQRALLERLDTDFVKRSEV